jgi:Cu/Ag efflux protein CusF
LQNLEEMMRKMMLAASAAALLAAVSTANAAEVTGMIKSIDASAGSITLDNGKTYKLPASIKASAWKVGEKVKVTFTEAGGQMTVSALAKAS